MVVSVPAILHDVLAPESWQSRNVWDGSQLTWESCSCAAALNACCVASPLAAAAEGGGTEDARPDGSAPCARVTQGHQGVCPHIAMLMISMTARASCSCWTHGGMYRLQSVVLLTIGSSGEIDVAEASDVATAEALRDSADAIDTDAMRFGGGPGAKALPRASRCCATDLQRTGERTQEQSSCEQH